MHRKIKKKRKASKSQSQNEVLAEKMMQTSIEQESIEDKLRSGIDQLGRESLVSAFAKEVLDFKVEQLMTKEEIDHFNKMQSYLRQLREKSGELERMGNTSWVDAWDRYEQQTKRVREQNEGLFLKMRDARKMVILSTSCRIRLESDRKTARDLSDTDLKDYILLARLLKYRTPYFNLNRYLETLFKGKQKGRPYQAYYEH